MKKVAHVPTFVAPVHVSGMALDSFRAQDRVKALNPTSINTNPSVVESNSRLRIATRLHFALLRSFGDSVEISDMLQRPAQTREVLWVCDASGDDELISLAKQFREANARAAAPTVTAVVAMPPLTPIATPAAAPQDAAWAHDTSGFGVSHPPEVSGHDAHTDRPSWLKSLAWLRGSRAR